MAAPSTKMRKKAMLEALSESLGVVTTASEMIGISRYTHYNWIQTDEKYKKAVEDLQNIALDFVENELFAQISKGEAASTIFYLKTKGKKRGYIERQEVVFPGAEDPTEFRLPGGRVVAI